jgi:hypothetical protein
MSFFINAALATLGIVTALFVAKILIAVFNVTLESILKNIQRNKAAKRREENAAYFTERRQRLEDKASQMLAANPSLAKLVEDLQDNPYRDGDNAANYKRAKLQKQLREMVPNKGLRDVFYGV